MRDGYRGYQIALHWVIAGVLPVLVPDRR